VTAHDKLDADFEAFNQKVDEAAQKEIQKIRQNLNALKNQAVIVNQTLLGSPADEANRR
jgi:hypothetical protein